MQPTWCREGGSILGQANLLLLRGLTGRTAKPMSCRGYLIGWWTLCANCVAMPCTYWKHAPNSMSFHRSRSSGSCRQLSASERTQQTK